MPNPGAPSLQDIFNGTAPAPTQAAAPSIPGKPSLSQIFTPGVFQPVGKNGYAPSTSPFNPNTQGGQFTDPNSKQPGIGFGGAMSAVGQGFSQTAKNLTDPIVGGAKEVAADTSQAFQGGINQVKQGAGEFGKGGDIVGPSLKIGAGVVNSALSPLAAPFKPVSNVIQAGANKIADIPAVQKFSDSKAGQVTAQAMEPIANAGTIAQGALVVDQAPKMIEQGTKGVNAVGEAAKPGLNAVKSDIAAVGNKMGDFGDALKSKAGDVRDSMIQKQADAIDEKLGLQKNTSAAIKARKLGDLTGQKTPGQVLAENNIPLDSGTAQTLQEHATARQATKQALLQTEGKWGNLDQWAAQAKDNLKLSGTALEKGKAIIDNELAAYKKQFASKGQIVDGELRIPLDQADKVKAGLGQAAYGKGLTTADQVAKTAQGQFSQAIKHGIENMSENPFVKALNREEGDFLNAKQALEGKDTSLLKTKPGIVSKVVGRAAQVAAGGLAGGIPGELVGFGADNFVANILAKAPENLRQVIINNLGETAEGQSLLSKVGDVIKQRQGETITRPQLPSKASMPGVIEGRPGSPDVINPGLKEVQNAKITKVKSIKPTYKGSGRQPVTQIFPGE